MQNLENIRNKGQEAFTDLTDRAKQQPDEVKTLGVTAATAVVGAVALPVVAGGVLAVVGALASPPIALIIGAVGGGALGWKYMQKQAQSDAVEMAPVMDTVVADEPEINTLSSVVTEEAQASDDSD